ncbi:MAG: hypothetical protein C0467_13690 [Planctomycetaceae bacterium]|nr:hypothetical protein [Planctomycetaceae bacterium]
MELLGGRNTSGIRHFEIDLHASSGSGLVGDVRVLHIVSGVASRYGGTTTAVLGLCEALTRFGSVKVEIAATDSDGPNKSLPANTFDGFAYPVHTFPVTGSERWKRSAGLRHWMHANASRFDLFHIHGVWSYSTLVGRRAAQGSGRPFVLSPHGMLSDYSFHRSAALKWAYWRLIERPTAQAAAAIMATSRGEANELQRLRLRAPVRVVPLGVNPEGWSTPPEREALRRRCGAVAGDKPIVLFLSRLHPKKGITDLLLPAFARLKAPAFLAIAGGVDESTPEYLNAIRNECERLGLTKRVALLGAIPPAERWQLFDGAAAFVLPSHQENFGIVVGEAMARGCPVIVSDQVQSCDHVLTADCGRVVPRDIGRVAGAIDDLLGDEQVRSGMGERGRAYATVRFGWDNIAHQFAAVYESCRK